MVGKKLFAGNVLIFDGENVARGLHGSILRGLDIKTADTKQNPPLFNKQLLWSQTFFERKIVL